ncbi:hypothetical protein BCR43DRAFT_509073 [Syncephalastrum racemosum]|uniref:Uncharacterized protein n=1 Tax=Syncephalastrum racemosum TaxID=13706 RepID=A0A1X2H0H8_SYNRA|nr:hypothetical protein BCR43DRAFT_509073 [Syncephalastrum racemosum]
MGIIPYGPSADVYSDEYNGFENHYRRRIADNDPTMNQYMMEALQDGLSWADAVRHAARRAAEEPFSDVYYCISDGQNQCRGPNSKTKNRTRVNSNQDRRHDNKGNHIIPREIANRSGRPWNAAFHRTRRELTLNPSRRIAPANSADTKADQANFAATSIKKNPCTKGTMNKAYH